MKVAHHHRFMEEEARVILHAVLAAAARAMFAQDFEGRILGFGSEAALATHHTAEFEGCEISLIDPWMAGASS